MVGRHGEAANAARQAVAADPESYRAMSTLALALLAAGAPADALDAATRAAGMRPTDGFPQRIRTQSLRALDRRRDALAAARSAVALEPESPDAQQLLAEILVVSNRQAARREALLAAEHAVALAPESPSAHASVGFVRIRTRKWAEAEVALRNALALDPEQAAARFNLAIALRQLGRADEAIAITSALIVEQPGDRSNVEALAGHAEAHVRAGPINSAMRTMMRLAVLRIPILFALLLAPFAAIERHHRRVRLTPSVRAAADRVRADPTVRRNRGRVFARSIVHNGLSFFGVIGAVVVVLVVVIVVGHGLFGWFG